MATKFLEPGGDADFTVATGNGFWGTTVGTVTAASDFVHGGHQRSIKYATGGGSVLCPTTLVGSTGRFSFYVYLNALPTATSTIFAIISTPNSQRQALRLTSGGVLQLWDLNNLTTPAQLGSNGATLSTGAWYRLSMAYTITSTTVNAFNVYVDGVSSIAVTNATLQSTGSGQFRLGNIGNDATLDMRSSDHYVDDSSSTADTGNIWVTAKRPVSNGTTNGFTAQIGSGGSGYGTGHAPQVNERPLSTTNGWSMVGVGSAVTEEYSIEGQSVGDINVTGSAIVDYEGWVSASSLASETASIIVANATSNVSLTSTITNFKKIASSSSYPAGNTDIGMITSTTLTTVSLYECGILIAFIPSLSAASTFFGIM